MQKIAVEVHLAAIAGFFVEGFAEFKVRGGLPPANVTHNVEEFLRRKMVAEYFTVIGQVNHVEWVKEIAAVYVDSVILVLEDVDYSRLCNVG